MQTNKSTFNAADATREELVSRVKLLEHALQYLHYSSENRREFSAAVMSATEKDFMCGMYSADSTNTEVAEEALRLCGLEPRP